MTPFFHALNTGTLAAWLSVTGAGVVGLFVGRETQMPAPVVSAAAAEWSTPEIILDPGISAQAPEAVPVPSPEPEAVPETLPVPLPAPPELAELAEIEPLPEIPELPAPVAKPPRPAPRPAATAVRAKPPKPSRASSGGTQRAAAPGGSGPADASRLAGGRMPAPSYPAEARRKGQTGTVLVEFTVDASGRVISAYAKNPSPWPLLNEEAVRTVRRWRFPPGGVMKLQRPIIFQLR